MCFETAHIGGKETRVIRRAKVGRGYVGALAAVGVARLNWIYSGSRVRRVSGNKDCGSR